MTPHVTPQRAGRAGSWARSGSFILLLTAGCAEVIVEDPPTRGGAFPALPAPDRSADPAAPGPAAAPRPGTNDDAPRLIDEDPVAPTDLSPGSDPPASGGQNDAPGPDAVPESPGEPGQLLFSDDFEDGDDAGWIADVSDGDDVVGSWAVVEAPDGWVYAQLDDSFDDDSWTVGGDSSWSDVVLEARFRFTSVRDMEDAVVMLATRFQSKDRYYYVQYRGDGSVKIRKRVDGSEPEMSSDDLDRLAVIGEWMTLRFSAVGNVLSAAVDGVVVSQGIIDDDLGFGGIALGVKENAAVQLDDVRVTLP